MMFHTKICGIRELADIPTMAAGGADAIGLNFFPQSIRFVDPCGEQAARLAAAAGDHGLLRIGVFVNSTADQLTRVADTLALDAIQLHGNEPLEIVPEIRRFTSLPLIRAIKLPVVGLQVADIVARTEPWIDVGCDLLLDADGGALHGGSGKTLDWAVISQWSGDRPAVSWALAGGLDPDNVAQAVRSSGASSVDVASGVEQPRGQKSKSRIQQFLSRRFSLT
jgi:phosphoribosylanthranilate isomerase